MLIEYIQRAIGYSLTGKVGEEVLHFLYGTGSNGKSTFINVIMALLGEYAHKAPTSMLAVQKYTTGIPNDVAALQGVRFAVTAELEEGMRLAEAKVKDLTATDPITARFLHHDYFTYKPTHKLWIYGNHKPIVRGNDNGIWRRLRLIPFTVQIPLHERKTDYHERLIAEELSGILNWTVEGCIKWQRDGLGLPEVIVSATSEYREEMDTIQQFLDEECIADTNCRIAFKLLYAHYEGWCKESNEYQVKKPEFRKRLEDKGIAVREGKANVLYCYGITTRLHLAAAPIKSPEEVA